jgi:hypothetical protein
MSVRQIIADTFVEVAGEQGRRLQPLTDDAFLFDLDLDSLCLAVIVARLEARLGTDPFTAGDDVPIPSTFGEFVSLYGDAAR